MIVTSTFPHSLHHDIDECQKCSKVVSHAVKEVDMASVNIAKEAY